ncbi:hypothetical protein KEM54_001343 [Ascosphaera aggregata]|nr:hypothetical protein KEM54_001343 [Ascosphaera aggregata]
MSVFRHGSSFLTRRLTELYHDTKSTCENVSSAAVRPDDDPELVALNKSFREQKDRLLAWGLDWSDANAAQPNDIDDALDEAGYTDVVAGVMSSIQELLNEAEQIQQPAAIPSGDSKSFPKLTKSVWTEAEISRSKELLEQLTSHIETLYALSRSRRSMSVTMNMNMNMNMNTNMNMNMNLLPGKYPSSKPLSRSSQVNLPKSFSKGTDHLKIQKKEVRPERPMSSNLADLDFNAVTSTLLHKYSSLHPTAQNHLLKLFKATEDYYINIAALQFPKDGLAGSASPPPYENLAAPNSRLMCYMRTSAMPSATATSASQEASVIPVLVDFTPIVPEIRNPLLFPSLNRLSQMHNDLTRLIDNAQVSHLGLLKFIGYYIDAPNSRYAFVYHVPPSFAQRNRELSPSIGAVKPIPLASLLFSPNERQDALPPHLENRFFLAYNLALSLLHLRSQNMVHGNINSHNIIIFPNPANALHRNSDDVCPDLIYPYLASFAHLDNKDKQLAPEPLSFSMYRHPDDNRIISDRSAWAYDFYSLGLVLLEIGLWTPLSALWKMKYDTSTFKSRLEKFYVKRLGSKCGSAYMKAVQLCLDAPNFVLSTTPMSDLSLRCVKTFTYPWIDASEASNWSVFSKNFACTITNILLRSASLDIFFPPAKLDLNEHLPPPLTTDTTTPPEILRPHASSDNNVDTAEVPAVEQLNKTPATTTTAAAAAAAAENIDKPAAKRSLRKLPELDIPNDDLAKWNGAAMPKLSKLLQRVLRGSAESCSVSLVMAGEAVESAKPTVCVTCASVKKVRAALRRYLTLDPGWDLIVLRGSVQHSKVPRSRRPRAKSSTVSRGSDTSDNNPCYQKTPICGASIGAFRHDEHLPPVSYGGAILVDGVPYGLTVHHMLDSPESVDEDDVSGDEDLPPRSSADKWVPSAELLGIAPQGSFHDAASSEESSGAEVSFILEATDDEEEDEDDDDDQSLALSFDDEDEFLSDDQGGDDDDDDDDLSGDDTASIGDTAGFEPGEQPPIPVTQPAFDDVEDGFFTSVDNRDDEHLASHSFGYVHASSGLRRWTCDGIKHEVDWALIRIDEKRLEASVNVVSGEDPTSSSYGNAKSENPVDNHSIIMLDKVAKVYELGGLNVHCCGRTSGLQSGKISRAMTLLKMHGRQSFSTSFSIDGNFGVPGDSGAWVFDRTTGRVCGHVLAWSEKCRTAYIAPMEILLADISRALGAKSVVLPGSQQLTNECNSQYQTTTLNSYCQHPAKLSSSLHAGEPASSSSPSPSSSSPSYPFPCSSSSTNATTSTAPRSKSETRKHKKPSRDITNDSSGSGHGHDERGAGYDITSDPHRSATRASRESASSSGSGGRDSMRGLREVAASSYHNVNALIAWQRTMMGRLPV